MNDTKPWWTSLTVWASIVALLMPLLRLMKVELNPQSQADAAGALMSLATAGAGAVSLYGRLRASKRIAPVRQ